MPNIIRSAGKVLLMSFVLVSAQAFAKSEKGDPNEKKFPSLFSNPANSPVIKSMANSIYDLISLGNYGLEREVFFNAYRGYQFLQNKGSLKKTNLLTICDYSQSSNNKRLYVVDLFNSRLLFNTFVSHGRNSGNEFATSFSNHDNSNKSSLGFLITEGAYNGKAGYSMRFNGMEPGINDHVKSRSIVLHGSRFVNEGIMNERGTIGKSLGCPAVPYGVHLRIINAIKGGSCFFINHPDQWYSHNSNILNAPFDLSPSIQTDDISITNDGIDNLNQTATLFPSPQ